MSLKLIDLDLIRQFGAFRICLKLVISVDSFAPIFDRSIMENIADLLETLTMMKGRLTSIHQLTVPPNKAVGLRMKRRPSKTLSTARGFYQGETIYMIEFDFLENRKVIDKNSDEKSAEMKFFVTFLRSWFMSSNSSLAGLQTHNYRLRDLL
jgi:hypothetical protein